VVETSRLSVPAESEQAMIVRQFVRLACHRYGCDAVVDNVLSVTDELLANAVAYGSPDPRATVEVGIAPRQGGGLRVEVHDHVHPSSKVAFGGTATDEQHGLQIVSSLAKSWGVSDDADGKVVWAEMSDSPSPAHA
jgi:anti-sigma regulatory factor (Ser/Thr protein kinase)